MCVIVWLVMFVVLSDRFQIFLISYINYIITELNVGQTLGLSWISLDQVLQYCAVNLITIKQMAQYIHTLILRDSLPNAL